MNVDELIQLVPPDEDDPRIQAALEELRGLIAARYTDATFTVYHGEDPDGIYLTPIVDVEDLDEVAEVFMDRLVDMQIEEGLPIYVVPDWPLARVREHLRHKTVQPIEERLPLLTP